MRIVCISDTHNYHKSVKLPQGDVLIHSGDATSRGHQHEIEAFGEWLRAQNFVYKIFVSGNHDFGFQDSNASAKKWLYGEDKYDHRHGLYYLQDEGMEIDVDGEKAYVYGSPWQPFFYNWAFNAYPDKLREQWDKIPNHTDILVTHGPSYDLLDTTAYGDRAGCDELRMAINRVKPKLHVFGHIHESHGVMKFGDTFLANSAICTVKYNPTQGPHVFEYSGGVMKNVSVGHEIKEVPYDPYYSD